MKIVRFRPTDLNGCNSYRNAMHYNSKKKIWPDESKWIRHKIHRWFYRLFKRKQVGGGE